MKGIEFVLMFHTKMINCSRLLLDSPNWIKNIGATINPKKNNNNRCFHNAVTIALNHESIRMHPQMPF